MAQGIVGIAAPEFFVDLVRKIQQPPVIYVAAVIRLAFGVVLFRIAPQSRAPIFLRILGVIIALGGILTPLFGEEFARIILGWWSDGGPLLVNAWAGGALLLGLFIVYAAAPRDLLSEERLGRTNWIRAFYSWHFVLSLGRSRIAIVVFDSLGGFLIVALGPLVVGDPIVILGALVLGIASPLFAWQVVVIGAKRVVIWRTILLIPYWVTLIRPGTEAELYEAWEERAPSSVAYKFRNDYAHIGNGWNAHALLELIRRCGERVRTK